jgi:O-antigen/teichoic acid export membrane protein
LSISLIYPFKNKISNIAGWFDNNADNLKMRCVRGSMILACGSVADRGLAFIRNIILTRLLVKAEMGVMVLLLSIVALFEMITDAGIKISVIQNDKGATEDYLNVVWWIQLIRGAGLYILGLILAGLGYQFFFSHKADVLALHSSDEIIRMIRICFLTVLMNGLISPRSYVLEKELKFFRVVLLTQGSAIFGIGLTIILCFWYRTVWSIIIGTVATAVFRTVVSYWICPFMPKTRFKRAEVREVLDFARRMFGLSFLTYLAYNLDVLCLGRMVSGELIGLYGMAVTLAAVPRDLFGKVVSPVLLSAFSEKQDHNELLSKSILRITKYISFSGFILFPFCYFYGAQLMSFIYGPSYRSAGRVFSILSLVILLVVQATVLSNYLFAKNMPEKHRYFTLVRAILLAAIIYPLIQIYGILGAAVAVLIANFAAILVQTYQIKLHAGIRIRDYWGSWIPGFVSGCSVFVAVWFIRTIVT